MANNIKLSKETFNLKQLDKVIDREFKTFKKVQPALETDTVEELYRLYDK